MIVTAETLGEAFFASTRLKATSIEQGAFYV